MKKRTLLPLLAVLVFLAGCGRSAPSADLQVGQRQRIPLQSVTLQGRETQAVFPAAAAVSDFAMVEPGELQYVRDQQLWRTRLDGEHLLERSTGHEEWGQAVTALNGKLRCQSDQQPPGFVSVKGDNLRYGEHNRLVAYRRSSAGAYDLLVGTPGGQELVVLSGLGRLELIGWLDGLVLVFSAEATDIPANVYMLDLRQDYAELIDSPLDTFSPGSYSSVPLVPGLAVKRIWAYDAESVAYHSGNKVHVHELTSGKTRELLDVGRDDVIWAEGNLFVSSRGDAAKSILWIQGEAEQLTGNSGFFVDWDSGKLYYMSHPAGQNRIFVFDLASRQEAQLAEASPEYTIGAFALSPDRARLLYVEATKADLGSMDQVYESLFILDLTTGQRQEVSGLSPEAHLRHEQMTWIKENLISLGHCRLMAPQEAQTLSFYTLSSGNISLKRQTVLNSGLFTADGQGVYLSDRDHSDGYDALLPSNVWYYGFEHDSLRQITKRAEWQVQQDQALAYHSARKLLFISRFKGSTLPDASDRAVHGVLIDQQGRESTLLKLRDAEILQAFWVGERLVVVTTEAVLGLQFGD